MKKYVGDGCIEKGGGTVKKGAVKYIVGGCFVGAGILLIIITVCLGGFGIINLVGGGLQIDFNGVHFYTQNEKLQTEGDSVMIGNNIKKLNMDIEYGEVIVQIGDVSDVEISTKNIIEKRFSYEVNGDTLNIRYKGGFSFFTWKTDAHIYVTFPEGTKFESSDIDNGAGSLKITGISSDVIKINNGAGDLKMSSVTAAEKLTVKSGAGAVYLENVNCGMLDVNSGVGEVRASDSVCGGLKLDNGMGAVYYTGVVNGDAKIDNGVGEIKMTLYGLSSDYNFDVDNGIGQVKINGNAPVNTDGGKYSFKIDTGIGEVRVDVLDKRQ